MSDSNFTANCNQYGVEIDAKVEKVCTKCLCTKTKENFSKDSSKKDGLFPSCKSCYSIYYAFTREKKLAYKKEYRTKNGESIAAYRAVHYANNADKSRAGAIAWAKENPVKRRANQSLRRAKKASSVGRYNSEDVARILLLQKGRCACCKRSVSDGYHIDHVMPLALGGSNDRLNIQVLCPLCNQQKHSKHPIDFMQKKGFLL